MDTSFSFCDYWIMIHTAVTLAPAAVQAATQGTAFVGEVNVGR
ncbi:hypothetical protein FB564_2064 [Salinispora arenicola]|uniref:Uncharacterized protein n=1 Tax=Salinispora arenicola TaxID=168697 RepID=A0A542XM54_SALAC|nr:hypothetical protein FB564_2064 [Salinispora arenicola]